MDLGRKDEFGVNWADATIVDLLDRAVQSNPDGTAVVSGADRLSYRELSETVDRLAQGLRTLGVTPGDRVALWLVNRTEWLLTYFAAARIGALLVAVNTRYTAGECRHVLLASEANVLVMQDEFRDHQYLDALGSICPEVDQADPGGWRSRELPSLRDVIVVGTRRPRGSHAFGSLVEAGRRVLSSGRPAPEVTVGPDDIFLVLFTSGTTSRSKGVTLTHRNIVPSNYYSGERQRLGPDDRMLIALPLSSAFACAHALVAIMGHFGTAVLLDAFSATACLRLIEQERCTSMYGVNQLFAELIEAPFRKDFDLTSMRTGVGVLTAEMAEAIRTELGFGEYHQGWGMTECGGVATVTSVVDPVEIRMRTVGTPVPGIELRIIDTDSGARAADGAVGEIVIGGAAITRGYYRDAEASAQLVDGDGWLHTGDLGLILPGGYLAYQGRIKDLIKPGGFNVSALEVEEAICSLPGVRSAAVVGVPDRNTMEAVFAFVVRQDAADLDAGAVRRHCAGQLAKFKVPKYVEFVGDLPRNDLSKVLKAPLQARARDLVTSAETRWQHDEGI
jgi:fatty-acyl-CoA synthase